MSWMKGSRHVRISPSHVQMSYVTHVSPSESCPLSDFAWVLVRVWVWVGTWAWVWVWMRC